jgi:hypothetical protein
MNTKQERVKRMLQTFKCSILYYEPMNTKQERVRAAARVRPELETTDKGPNLRGDFKFDRPEVSKCTENRLSPVRLKLTFNISP